MNIRLKYEHHDSFMELTEDVVLVGDSMNELAEILIQKRKEIEKYWECDSDDYSFYIEAWV